MAGQRRDLGFALADSQGPLILLSGAQHSPFRLISGVWPSLPGGAPGSAHQRVGTGGRSHPHRPQSGRAGTRGCGWALQARAQVCPYLAGAGTCSPGSDGKGPCGLPTERVANTDLATSSRKQAFFFPGSLPRLIQGELTASRAWVGPDP